MVIENMDMFAAVLKQWHQAKVATLKHTMKVPAGTELTVNDGAPIVLEGEFLKGFLLGIDVSLMEFENLPFFADNSEPEMAESAVQSESTADAA